LHNPLFYRFRRDNGADPQREAGAYHKSQNSATTLRKIFLPEKNLRGMYLRLQFFLEIQISHCYYYFFKKMTVKGSMGTQFLNEEAASHVKFMAVCINFDQYKFFKKTI
jgi:hypothetical protein